MREMFETEPPVSGSPRDAAPSCPPDRSGRSPGRWRALLRLSCLLAPALLGGCKLFELAGLVNGQPQVSPPVISPAGGDYTAAQSVTMADSTSGAAIYYTTDGSTPTAGSTRYVGPISVAGNGTLLTIRAIALKSGMTASAVAATAFSIRYGTGATQQASAPAFNPPPGSYGADQSVVLSDATSGAVIYYTTDGSTPTTGSPVYSAPIPVAGNGTSATIRAVATAAGTLMSPVVSSSYRIDYTQAATPVFTPSTGTSSVDLNSPGITIASTTAGAAIYYTMTSGTISSPPASPPTPTTSSTPYAAPIPVAGDQTVVKIAAIAVAAGFGTSGVGTDTITIDYGTASTPQLMPAGGSYSTNLDGVGGDAAPVTITDSTPGAVIHYTTDGSAPTASSPTYTAAIPITGNGTVETIEAVAIAPGYKTSALGSATYTISYPQDTVVPSISVAAPSGGAISSDGLHVTAPNPSISVPSVTLSGSAATSSTVFHYIVSYDNTSPPPPSSSNSATQVASGPTLTFGLSGISDTAYHTVTIEAYAVDPNTTPGPLATATFSVNQVIPAPAFSVAGGTYSTAQSVTLSDALAPASVYYTLDGTTPTYPPSGSTSLYSAAAISVATNGASETIDAIAEAAGYVTSAVASASYAILPVPALTLGSAASTSIAASWSAVAGATGYTLTRDTSPTFTVNPTTVYVGTGTSATDTGLSPSTTYYYELKAVYPAGLSGGSTASGPTLNASGMPVVQSVPAPPSGTPTPPPPAGAGDYWYAPYASGWAEGGYTYYVYDHDFGNSTTSYVVAYDSSWNIVKEWSYPYRYLQSAPVISGSNIILTFQNTVASPPTISVTISWSSMQL